jgi:predicted RecA/RadA family phage recombinase
MATIALVTANKVEVVERLDAMTLPASAAIVAGAPVQVNASGKWASANATTAALARRTYIATRTVNAGEALTGVRQGVMDGWDLSALAYNAPVYLSDTGTIADAAGTVATIIGYVGPGWAQPLGTAADKILMINTPNA